MKKGRNKSLKKRVELAERRAADCERRMRGMHREMRRSNAISDGSQIMCSILAGMIGPEFHISAEEVDAGKRAEYACRMNGDGTYDFCRKDILAARGELETAEGAGPAGDAGTREDPPSGICGPSGAVGPQETVTIEEDASDG